MPRVALERHPYTEGVATLTGKDGRVYRLCSACHRIPNYAAHWGFTPPRRQGAASRPARLPAPPPVPREVRLLALALDAVLALDADRVGWRLRIRAGDCRAAITEVPPDPTEEHEPGLPHEPEPVPDRPEADRQITSLDISKVARSNLARARQQTRGIRDGRMRDLAILAVVQGWQLRKTGGGHALLWRDGHEPISFSMTSDGSHRGWMNVRAQARRAGIEVV